LRIYQGQLRQHVDGLVRDAVQDTLNALLEAEADALCHAKRYERSPDRTDYRAGSSTRQLHTKAGEVELKVPKPCRAIFESQIIERYRRRETSVEEALVECTWPACPSVAWRTSPRPCGARVSAPARSAS
jgi:transposase-like protein